MGKYSVQEGISSMVLEQFIVLVSNSFLLGIRQNDSVLKTDVEHMKKLLSEYL